MSSVENAVRASLSLKPMQVVVVGRVVRVEKFKNFYATAVLAPAPDVYSHPSMLEIRSKERIADKDSDIRQLCSLSGFQRLVDVTDRNTGEINKKYFVDVKLDAVVTS